MGGFAEPTLLCKAEEAQRGLALGNVQVALAHPAKEVDTLRKHGVAFQVVGGDGLRGGELRRKGAGRRLANEFDM